MEEERYNELLGQALSAPTMNFRQNTSPLPKYDGDQMMAGIMNKTISAGNVSNGKSAFDNVKEWAGQQIDNLLDKSSENYGGGGSSFDSKLETNPTVETLKESALVIPGVSAAVDLTAKSMESFVNNMPDELANKLYTNYVYGPDDRREVIKKAQDYFGITPGMLAKAPDMMTEDDKRTWEKVKTLVYQMDKLKKVPKMLNEKGQLDMTAVKQEYPYIWDIMQKRGTNEAVIALQSASDLRKINDVYKTSFDKFTKTISAGRKRGELSAKIDWTYAKIGKEKRYPTAEENAQIKKWEDELKTIPGNSYDDLASASGSIIGSVLENAPLMIEGQGVKLATAGTLKVASRGKIPTPIALKIGDAASVLVMGAHISGAQYKENLYKTDENGNLLYTPEQAAYLSGAQGLLEGILEQYALNQIFNAAFLKTTTKALSSVYSEAAAAFGGDLKIAAANKEVQDAARAVIYKRIGEVATAFAGSLTPELLEEIEQQASDMVIENIAQVMINGKDAQTQPIEEIIGQSLNSGVEAIPAVVGFGIFGAGGNVISNSKRILKARDNMSSLMGNRAYRAVYENNNRAEIISAVGDNLDNMAELQNKAPELVTDILDSQNEQYGIKETAVDVVSLKQEAGDEVVNEIAKANDIPQEELDVCQRNKGMLTVSTSTLQQLSAKLDDAKRKALLNNISSPERGSMTNKQIGEYIEIMRDVSKAFQNQNDQDAKTSISNFVKGNFDENQRALAEDIISTSIDRPVAELRRRKKLVQDQINELLSGAVEQLKKGMGNGVDVVDNARVSNSAEWYQAFYAENGRQPNAYELEQIARDIVTNTTSKYNTEVTAPESEEEQQYYDELKNTLDGLMSQRDTLNDIEEKIKDIQPGDIIATATLSPEARQVYSMLIRGLSEGNKEVKAAARANALLAARMADREAKYHQEAGDKNFTALDALPGVIANATKESTGAVMRQAAAMRQENKQYVTKSNGSINWGYAEIGGEILPVRVQIGYQVGDNIAGMGLVHIKQRHIQQYKKFGDLKKASELEPVIDYVLEEEPVLYLNAKGDYDAFISDRNGMGNYTAGFTVDVDDSNDEKYLSLKTIIPMNEEKYKKRKEKALSNSGTGSPQTRLLAVADGQTSAGDNARAPEGSSPRKDSAYGTISISEVDSIVNNLVYDNNGNPVKALKQSAWHRSSYNNVNTLVGVHNLSEENLRHVLKMGGLANPSLGVVDVTKQAIEGFGEITLIAPTTLIDKSTGRNAGTYAADIYSPRYPTITKSLDENSFGMLEDKLRSILKKDNVFSLANMIAENIDGLRGYSGLYQVFVADKYGVENAPTAKEALNFVYNNKLEKEYGDYVEHFLDDIPITEKIFNGYTPSGKRKYLSHTLANVSKYMKAQGRQAAESFNYGLGSFRALLTPKATNTKQIKKWKERLVNNEELKKAKEELDKEFDEYVELASGRHDWDVGAARLAEAVQLKRDIPSHLENEYGIAMSEETANNLRKFVQKLVAMPTEYFETKFERPVTLNEFAGALVPKDLPNDLKEELQKSVYYVYEYDDNENRTEALAKATKDLAQRRNVLFQSTRGEYNPATNIISLFETADQSTFMHEMSHAYLEDLRRLAERFPNSQAAKDFNAIMTWAGWQEGQAREYADTKSAATFMRLEAEIQAAIRDGNIAKADRLKAEWAQERFARAFEEYLRSGEAPTTTLTKIFRRFKKWLCDIYGSITGAGVRATPEIEAIMARMVATDAEIEAAATAKELDRVAGIDKDLIDADTSAMVERWTAEAKEQAKEKLLAELVKEYEARDMEKHLEEFKAGIIEAFKQLRCYQAEAVADEMGEQAVVDMNFYPSIETWKADREQYGGKLSDAVEKAVAEEREAYKKAMPSNDELAARAEEEIASGEYAERITALEVELLERREKKYAKAPKRLLKAFEQAEKAETPDELSKALLELKYATQWEAEQSKVIADLIKEVKELRNEKDAAFQSDADKAEAIKDLKAKSDKQSEKMKKLIGMKKKVNSLKEKTALNAEWLRKIRDAAKGAVKQFREYALAELSVMKVSEATNTRYWLMAAQRESKNCAKLITKAVAAADAKEKDRLYAEARDAKQRQVVYEAMTRESLKLKRTVSKIERHMQRRMQTILKDKTHKIDVSHKYYIGHLLYAFGFRTSDAVKPATAKDVSELFQELTAAFEKGNGSLGDNVDGSFNPPEWLRSAMTADKAKNYKQLTMEELDALTTMVNFLYTSGKNKNLLIGSGELVDDVVAELSSDFAESVALNVGEKREVNSFMAQLLKPEVLLKILGSSKGSWIKRLYKPLFDAMDVKRQMQEKEAETIVALFDKYWTKKEREHITDDEVTEFAGEKLTKENILAMALNWGNEGNRGRLIAGLADNGRYHVSEKTIREEIFAKFMTAKDWEFVQEVWDHISDYGDQVNVVIEKCTGSPMKRVAPDGFAVKTADGKEIALRGGYYPIKYDPEKSSRQQENDITTAAQAIGGASAFGTGMGSTKKRAAKTPNIGGLLLNLDVMSNHINEQIHIIAMRIACRDVYKLLNNKTIRNDIEETFGRDVYRQTKEWCENTWQEPIGSSIKLVTYLSKLRAHTVTAIMAYRVSTALLNFANIVPMADKIGWGNSIAAISQYITHPRAVRQFVLNDSSFMRDRAHNMDRDLNKQQKNLFGGTGKLKYQIDKYANWLIEETDMLCSIPLYYHVYQQSYNEALAAGKADKAARDAAHFDAHEAVRNVFGSADIIDQSQVQRTKEEIVKLFTPFYSFFNAQMNAVWEKYYQGKYGGRTTIEKADDGSDIIVPVRKAFITRYGSFIHSYMMRFVVMAGVETLIRQAIAAASAGRDDKDKEDWYIKFSREWAKNSLDSAMGGFPIMKDIAAAAETAAEYYFKGGSYRQSRNVGVVEASLERVVDPFYQAVKISKGKADLIDLGRSVNKAADSWFGIPDTLTDALWNTARFISDNYRFNNPDDLREFIAKSIFDKKLKAK